MSELQKLLDLLHLLDVSYVVHDDIACVHPSAQELGGIKCISIKTSAHLYFDVKGNCVGSDNDEITSYRQSSYAKKILANIEQENRKD